MCCIKSFRNAFQVEGTRVRKPFDWLWRLFEKFDAYQEGETMHHLLRLWHEDEAQDIAEYAVMLAVILVIVVGTIRLIGSNANNVFSNVASSIQ
jgi:Flp pilus assembly pilin Flp